MSRIDLKIPSLGGKFTDIRDTIPGDSFNWSWVRPLSQVKYLAIHHSAGPDNQSSIEIANYHINNNGWGGIGYHFVIAKDGSVYYVGDISTARANVANLNEQVIGICLIGNFMSGNIPSNEQLDSASKLCDFFINNYPDLSNVTTWDAVRGHKELPGQSTACPGDTWNSWKGKLTPSSQPMPAPAPETDRGAEILKLYRTVLGRDPDMGGLQTYTNGPMSIVDIMAAMVNSDEHKNLIQISKEVDSLKSQVDNLQTTLASVNQQAISLQEAIGEKDQEINDLRNRLSISSSPAPKVDTTLTIVGALINLYNFIFQPGKEAIL